MQLANYPRQTCRHCGKRVVHHNIGRGVTIWTHAQSNLIWCGSCADTTHTATPRWNLERNEKWSNA